MEMCRFGAGELHVVAAFVGGMAAQVRTPNAFLTVHLGGEIEEIKCGDCALDAVATMLGKRDLS